MLGASILSFHSTVAAMDFGTQVGIDAYRKNDFAQAAEQFKDAGMVRGDSTAQLFLGVMYYNGEFLSKIMLRQQSGIAKLQIRGRSLPYFS